MLRLLVVEDNLKLRSALEAGFSSDASFQIAHSCGSGEQALDFCLTGNPPDAILMDVQLEGVMNGIQAAIGRKKMDCLTFNGSRKLVFNVAFQNDVSDFFCPVEKSQQTA